jgi:hypothetical protein
MLAVALAAALACPAQPALTTERRGRNVWHTAIVACDGDRPVVVRRARLSNVDSRYRGAEITDVWAGGRRFAWAEVRYSGRRSRSVVGVSRLTRTVHRRVVHRSGPKYQWLDVVLTTRGELAWAVAGRVRTARIAERRARTLGRGYGPLGLEDDRTVRWWADEKHVYADIRPWPGPGCPRRSRFRTIGENDRVVVSVAEYRQRSLASASSDVRVCVRATGDDPVVAHGGDPDEFRLGGLAGDWVVLSRRVNSRSGCEWLRVEVLRAGTTGRPGTNRCDEREPDPSEPLAVTESGVPAWIVTTADRSALITTGGHGLIELDAAAPGGLTGLSADGRLVRWVHDGEPRSMDLG